MTTDQSREAFKVWSEREIIEACAKDLTEFQQRLNRTDGGAGGHGKSIPYSKGLLLARGYLSAATPDQSREALAKWMVKHSFTTGHGDTLADLLKELSWQVKEMREAGWNECREAAAQIADKWTTYLAIHGTSSYPADAIRALSAPAAKEPDV